MFIHFNEHDVWNRFTRVHLDFTDASAWVILEYWEATRILRRRGCVVVSWVCVRERAQLNPLKIPLPLIFFFFIYELFKCLVTLLFCCVGRILARCVARGDECLYCKQGFLSWPCSRADSHSLCAWTTGPFIEFIGRRTNWHSILDTNFFLIWTFLSFKKEHIMQTQRLNAIKLILTVK